MGPKLKKNLKKALKKLKKIMYKKLKKSLIFSPSFRTFEYQNEGYTRFDSGAIPTSE